MTFFELFNSCCEGSPLQQGGWRFIVGEGFVDLSPEACDMEIPFVKVLIQIQKIYAMQAKTYEDKILLLQEEKNKLINLLIEAQRK